MNARWNKITARLASKVMIQPSTGCWIWTGGHSGAGRGGGYGRVWVDTQMCAAHIVMFTQVFGYVPGKMQIDHDCENRRCVNPHHLKCVTHKRNQELRGERTRARQDQTHEQLQRDVESLNGS